MTEDFTDQANRHERVRFRRDEIVDLCALASSNGLETAPRPSGRRKRAAKVAVWAGTICVSLMLLVVAGLYYISYSGLGARQLQAQAESALQRMLGSDFDISIASAHFSLSGPSLLNLELADVSLGPHDAATPLISSADLRLGLDVLPLLGGNVSIASAELSAARINADRLATPGASDGLRSLRNADGLIDPDLLLAAIFSGADLAAKTATSGGAPDLALRDVTFSLGPGLPFSSVTVQDAQLQQSDLGASLAGTVLFDERAAEFTAALRKPAGSSRVEHFKIDFSSARSPAPDKSFSFGDMLVTVVGDRSVPGQPAKVQASVDAKELSVDLGTRGRLTGRLDMMTTLADASGKIEIDHLDADIGRSAFRMNGAIGPRPAESARPEPAAYRFELVSNDSELVPEDTGEPKMPMRMRLGGSFRPDNGLIDVNDVSISSPTGTAAGNASVTLTQSGPPGITLALDVDDMSVSHVKQLWPWFAGPSARRWVNTNLFGGTVPEGGIRFAVAPGRLGNGEKLGNDEVSGHFKIVGTRFDTTGLLPPIRDADGQVTFAGDDVDIGLEKGHVFLASGATVNADKGRLVIRDAGTPPVLGNLEIDVSGAAAAVAELASLEPINAMRHTGIEPAALSGAVEGTIKARIPMQKGIDKSQLDWDVRLGFRDMAIAKPIEGQTIRSADGTLEVNKARVVIDASAELNGVPAQIDLVEPLPGSSDARRRDIAMSLNRASLQKVAPGLGSVIDGPVKVTVDASNRESHHVEADLSSAVVSIPAVGWSKGSGIAAGVSFDLHRGSDSTALSNFKLSGGSFGATGSITVAGGALASARFDSFKLNRDDDASLKIERERGSYSLVVSGNSLDARSLIRRATSPQAGPAAARPSTPVAVRGTVKRLIGFNDEQLSGVTFNFASGKGGSTLTVEGQTSREKTVSIDNRGNSISVQTQDAGSLLRFLDVYERVEGGTISVRLESRADGSLAGPVDLRDFLVVNEPKLRSIVSATPQGTQAGQGGSTASRVDTSRVAFDRGFARVEKGASYLKLNDGVLRGPAMGTTFQGLLYDKNNRMEITGTFMPAYELNSLFGDVPIVGALLGNGEEKGLIGVTYKLVGSAKAPNLQINPLSVIAPGIFRTIFAFQ